MAVVVAAIVMTMRSAVGIAYEVIEVANGGSIQGEVTLGGTPLPPKDVEITKDQDVCGKTEKRDESLVVGENAGLQNVVVSIVDMQKGKSFSAVAPVLDQRECRYDPHIVLVPAGVPLRILNTDGILHSVHTRSEKNPPFNKAQSKFKKEMFESFAAPEIIAVTCDVHPWMRGWIVVQEHPYLTVTDTVGKFHLDLIPPGEYRLRFWHETLGMLERTVAVSSGVATVVSIRWKQ
jgi:plastocyanin